MARASVRVALACMLAVGLMPSLAFAEDAGQSETYEQSEGTPFASAITDEEIASVLSESDSEAQDALIVPLSVDSREVSAQGAVRPFSGANRYETAALQATYGWQSSRYAVVAGGYGWPDALTASSLAGALDCPVLLTPKEGLDASASQALSSLGVSHVVVVGDENAVSAAAADAIGAKGIAVERLGGADRYATQMEIYRYGADPSKNPEGRVLWGSDAVVLASGVSPADALSASPVAFCAKAPVFLADASCSLNADQLAALSSAGGFATALVMGDTNRVSKAAESAAAAASGRTERFAGADRYDTSARVAKWGIQNGFLGSWEGSAFATGQNPADALGGGALQGRERSPLLLVDDGWCGYATSVLKGSGVSYVKFFGDTPSVSSTSRVTLISALNLARVAYTDYSISLSALADLEVKAVSGEGYPQYSKSQVLESLDPNNFAFGTRSYYQFAVLTDGYSGIVSASQLNSFIASTSNGRNGMLAGTGEYFVEAAKTYGMNEVYLLSNAILESGWGTSTLAKGYYYDGKTEIGGKKYPAGTYYNFFGIGAYDGSPLAGGRSMAIKEGWNTPKKAILGAAKWISANYHKPTVSSGAVSGPQNTLYRMKWDVQRAVLKGEVWHQYATSRTWATGISSVMFDCYTYNSIPVDKAGLRFDVPRYR